MGLGKYNREERQTANKIYKLKGYLNSKRGTVYSLNKKSHCEMLISILKEKLNGKYKERLH